MALDRNARDLEIGGRGGEEVDEEKGCGGGAAAAAGGRAALQMSSVAKRAHKPTCETRRRAGQAAPIPTLTFEPKSGVALASKAQLLC